MWHGTYKRWTPIPELDGQRLDVEAVHDDWEGLRVWLRPEDETKPMAIFRFADAEAYFASNESNRVVQIKPAQKLTFPHAFWQIEDSEFLATVSRQSCGTERKGLIHYSFIGTEHCIDVLAWEPEVQYET